MGAGQSTSQSHPPSRALHVLRVTPSSPASETNIEPFFDFVVGFEEENLSSENNIDASELERIVESHEGQELNLLVWNSKTQETRVVPIVPSRQWSQSHFEVGEGQNPEHAPQPSLLGLSMRMCEPEYASDNVWHVLDVIEGSPAESAGLVPMGDWILGWSGGVLSAENDFYDLVEAHVDKPLRVYVYSHDFDTLREVVLIPNRHWGGEGLLGCVFGFGLLHRIPNQLEGRPENMTPPELHDQSQDYDDQQDFFVPADIQSEPQITSEQLAEWRQQELERWQYESAMARSAHQNHSNIPQVEVSHYPERSDSRPSHRAHSYENGTSATETPIPSGQKTPVQRQHSPSNNATPTQTTSFSAIHGSASQAFHDSNRTLVSHHHHNGYAHDDHDHDHDRDHDHDHGHDYGDQDEHNRVTDQIYKHGKNLRQKRPDDDSEDDELDGAASLAGTTSGGSLASVD